jgi:hypothetical protein
MLNLRQINTESGSLSPNGISTVQRSTILFNPNILVGNMGESLEFGTRNEDGDLENEEGEDTAIPLSSVRVSSDAYSARHIASEIEVSDYKFLSRGKTC